MPSTAWWGENSTRAWSHAAGHVFAHPCHVVGEVSPGAFNLLRQVNNAESPPQALAQMPGLAVQASAARRAPPGVQQRRGRAWLRTGLGGVASERSAASLACTSWPTPSRTRPTTARALPSSACRTRWQTAAPIRPRLHQPHHVGAEPSWRCARPAGAAAEEAHGVSMTRFESPRPHRSVGVLLLHRHRGPPRRAQRGKALA